MAQQILNEVNFIKGLDEYNRIGYTVFSLDNLDERSIFDSINNMIIMVKESCMRLQPYEKILDRSYFSGYLTNFGFAHLYSLYKIKFFIVMLLQKIFPDLVQPIFNCEAPFFLNSSSLPYTKRHCCNHEDFLKTEVPHYRILVVVKEGFNTRKITLTEWTQEELSTHNVTPPKTWVGSVKKTFVASSKMVILFNPRQFKYSLEKQTQQSGESYLVLPISITDAYYLDNYCFTHKERFVTSRLSCFAARRTSKSLAFPLTQRAIFADIVNVYQTLYLDHKKYSSQNVVLRLESHEFNYWFDDDVWEKGFSCLNFIRFPVVKDIESISDASELISSLSEEEQEDPINPENGSTND